MRAPRREEPAAASHSLSLSRVARIHRRTGAAPTDQLTSGEVVAPCQTKQERESGREAGRRERTSAATATRYDDSYHTIPTGGPARGWGEARGWTTTRVDFRLLLLRSLPPASTAAAARPFRSIRGASRELIRGHGVGVALAARPADLAPMTDHINASINFVRAIHPSSPRSSDRIN
jgi:hypothetical protein